MLKSVVFTLGMAIIVCLIMLYSLLRRQYGEGFYDINSDYNDLRSRLSGMMATYCDLANYAQSQMKVIYMSPKPLNIGITETASQADAHIQRTYKEVYGCKDDMASSRQSCSGGIDAAFIPCEIYMKLPDLTDTNGGDIGVALSKIPDNLADRISREVDWYSQIVNKLTDALALGNSPPKMPPNSESSPVADSSGKPWSSDSLVKKQGFIDYIVPQNRDWLVEGFAASQLSLNSAQLSEGFARQSRASATYQRYEGFAASQLILNSAQLSEGFADTCTADQIQTQINIKRKADQEKQAAAAAAAQEADAAAASSCTMPTPDTEIPRVNKILDSKELQAALAKCAALKTAMEKLKSDQQKAKDGTLYAWQQDGPTRTFPRLPIGNRTDGLLSSLKQNMG